ncbi:hypothetical protein PM082_010266 [Marasmius tenuissimus]|nr:hypothetical protein PM082_010266 [Marasmius tenuissimus]
MIQFSSADLILVFVLGYVVFTLIVYLLFPRPSVDEAIGINLSPASINTPCPSRILHPLPRKNQSSPSHGVVVYSSLRQLFDGEAPHIGVSFTPSICLQRLLGDRFRLKPPPDCFPGSTSIDPASLAALTGLHRPPPGNIKPFIPEFIWRHRDATTLADIYERSRAPRSAPVAHQARFTWGGYLSWRSFSPRSPPNNPSCGNSEAERSDDERSDTESEDEDEDRQYLSPRRCPSWTYQLLRLPINNPNGPPSIYLDCTTGRCSKRLGFDIVPRPADSFWWPVNDNHRLRPCNFHTAWKSVLFHLVKWDLDPQLGCFEQHPYDYEVGTVCRIPTVEELGEIMTGNAAGAPGDSTTPMYPVPVLQAYTFVGRDSEHPTPLRLLDFREVKGAFKQLTRVQLRNVSMTTNDCWELLSRCPNLDYLCLSGRFSECDAVEDCVLAESASKCTVSTTLKRLDIVDRCEMDVVALFEYLLPIRLDVVSLSLSFDCQMLLSRDARLPDLVDTMAETVTQLLIPGEDFYLRSSIEEARRIEETSTNMRIRSA